MILALLIIRGLVVELIDECVVVPVGLANVLFIHLVDDFFVLLGAVVGLVVLLARVLVVGALLPVPVLLLVDEGLVHLEVVARLCLGLAHLGAPELDIVVELILLDVALLLQLEQVVLVALEGCERCLISHGHLLIVVGVAVAQTVVVEGEGSV